MKKFYYAFILTLIVCCVLLGIKFFEKEEKEKPVPAHYVSTEIKWGDSLWSMSEEHRDYYDNILTTKEYIEEVKIINGMKYDRIVSGGYLILPIYETNKEGN